MSMTGTGRAATHLGREELLERLADAVSAALEGRGAFVVLRGPAGSGTSTTALEVAARAADRGFAVREASFEDGLRARPYGALATLLDIHAAGMSASDLADQLGAGAPALARIAPALRASLPGIAPPAPLAAFDERLRLFDAYAGWLRRASVGQPLLLLLDNLQWADGDAVGLLDHALRRTADSPVLVLATWTDSRSLPGSEGTKASAAALLERARVHELGGLDKGATAVLLGRVADRPIAPPTLDLIQQLTGGQPLAAMELYRHLREEGHVGRPGGDSLPPADDLPRRLDEIVAWRAAGLPPESRSALTALACFAEGAPPALLAPVAGLTRARLVQALEEPLQRGLAAIAGAGSPRYSIPHDAIRRALLAQLEPRLLAHALRAAAQALEAESGPDPRTMAPLLAELYTRSAAEPGGAAGLRHCLIAAEQARAAAAFGRAADILAAAANLAGPSDSTGGADLHRRLLEARADAGQGSAAVTAAEQLWRHALSGRGPAADLRPLVDAARSLRAWGADGDVAALVALGWRAGGGKPTERRRTLGQARLELLDESWQPAGDDLPAQFWSQVDDTTERLLLSDGDEADRADLFAPQRRRSHEQTVALLTMSRDWRRPASLLAALRGGATDLTTRLGRFIEAASWAVQYLAAAERYGSVADVCRALLFVGRCRAVLGDLDAASDALDKADELLAEIATDVDLGDERLLARLSLAHSRDGNLAALAHDTEQRIANGVRSSGLALTAELALASARLADAARARAGVTAIIDCVERWPPLTYLRDEALLSSLTAAWELGWAVQVPRSRALLEHAAAEGIGGNHAATPGLALARLSALVGSLDEARAAFAAERPLLEAAGLRPLRAIADHDEGIALAAAEADPTAATERLRAAAAAFAELGMDGWLERTERLLDGGFEAARRPGGRLHFTYPADLSRREVDIVRLMAGGASSTDAATTLEIEPSVLERHLASALAKLGSDDLADLPRLARRHGLGGGT